MFTHHKLKVYRKAVESAGSLTRISDDWAREHPFVDHLRRASESVVLNIAEGARLRPEAGKVVTLDYAVGSTLECSACLDIAEIKGLLPAQEVLAEKRQLCEIARMLIGLRKSWGHGAMMEESPAYASKGSAQEVETLFHHERLEVYQVGLKFMRGLCSWSSEKELSDRKYRQLEKFATSLILNIAEGNGRYSELDHRRFLEIASASAVKCAVYLDLCEEIHGASV